ncbi:SAM-dependent methyltransferase [Streptomyces reniochalinae]|uniref:SAM-dependent methyltransferase n=1 Tax=Streptomyces reniochalinae TaxID=2250578 RepID=A0A367ECC2_9ACTN|nr:SAM-dependent methyltransferase [Streptomyces reniochalinae]RCG14880.1 SAM-dependent methyltransferase [Streptomyces reniochalinae]
MGSMRQTVDLRVDKPHSARMYDYLLGGKTHYPADRAAAVKATEGWPGLPTAARANRAFLHRAVRYLVREAGVRQFLDVGTGIPTSPNLHEVAQAENPSARIVYADNDPIVLTHARALLRSSPQGRTAYLDADLREPNTLLEDPQLAATLDLSEPVALTLIATVHFVPDHHDPFGAVATLMDTLPSGSYLLLSHATPDFSPEEINNAVAAYHAGGIEAQVRSYSGILPFFDGLHLLDPGLVVITDWHPETTPFGPPAKSDVSFYGGLARKP